MENTVKERVINLRNSLNLSQTEFAGKIGLSQVAIWRIESGESIPRRSTLQAISSAFGIDKNWLINGVGEMILPGQNQELQATQNVWKDALVSQLKDENLTLKEQVKMMMQTIVNLTSQKSFPNDIIGAGLFQMEKFGNIVRA
jgi:transcriptional regulator with XRE-family HTH domain